MLHREVAGGDQDGPGLVLVHGFTQTRRSWDVVVGPLARRHRVIVVDAPGHGRSADVRLDMVGAAELLGETCGEATYVGYSMGGRLALHLAVARPDLVHRLVLVGATPGIEDAGERRARLDADERLAGDLEQAGLDAFLDRWLSNPLFRTLPAEAAGRDARMENTVDGLAASLRLMGTGAQASLWDHLPLLRMPVLLVVGEADEKFRDIAARMATAWGGRADVAVVPGAGHAVHLERPDEFVHVVSRFVAEVHPAAIPPASSSP